MSEQKSLEYVLGLDIGVNSIGWAILETHGGKPKAIVKTGVRVFPFDADFERDFRAGRPASLAAPRREARLMRRMIERRARRQTKLFNLLVKAGLLPAGDPVTVIPSLDREILSKQSPGDRQRLAHVMVYALRKRALDAKVEPYELGRAMTCPHCMYHILC